MTAAAAVHTPHFTVTHDDLSGDPFDLRRAVAAGGTVALRTRDAAVIASALVSLDGWAGSVHLLPESVHVEGLEPIDSFTLRSSGDGVSNHEPVATRFVVYTSGTTGAPKPVQHTIATLSRTVVTSAAAGELRWGLLYDPNRMAGLQVVLQSLATKTTLVAPDHHQPLATRVDTLITHQVSALSATPTLWRLILQLPAAETWTSLRQITLGGEIADQHVLGALGRTFPSARIAHIFASTETGAAFSVVDGRAGFPLRYLSEPPRGIALQVRNGILFVHAPDVSTADADGFVSTGDRVRVDDDRVLFLGRESGVVNVGGANVWPEEVETLLRQHPEVTDALVTARANALSGHVLIATVSAAPHANRADLGKRLRLWLRDQLPASHVPAMVKIVDEFTTSDSGKLQR